MKRFETPDGALEEFSIGSNRMPEWERRIFTNTGARLFLGRVEGTSFGCVRMLETGKTDETGRKCYNNIAFEGSSSEKEDIWAMMTYARYHYHAFAYAVNQIIYYKDADYNIDYEKFAELKKKSKTAFADKILDYNSGFLVLESSEDYFFTNAYSPVAGRDAIGDIVPFEEIIKEDLTMKVFFYCTSPSMGFVLKQIDYETGEVLRERKEAADSMPPNTFPIMTRSGAEMALYQTKDELCFVAKNIRSETTDCYGRHKHTSLVLSASKERKNQLRQFAAWALLDYKAFAKAVTDCLEVYDGPKGYQVKIDQFSELFERFNRTMYIQSAAHKEKWRKLVEMAGRKPFQYLVLDAKLDYFISSTGVQVSPTQVGMLIEPDAFANMKNDALQLTFSEDLYNPPIVEKKMNALESGEKVMARRENETVVTSASNATRKDKAEVEEDCINLLEYKWFKAVLTVGAVVLVGLAVFWMKRLFGK